MYRWFVILLLQMTQIWMNRSSCRGLRLASSPGTMLRWTWRVGPVPFAAIRSLIAVLLSLVRSCSCQSRTSTDGCPLSTSKLEDILVKSRPIGSTAPRVGPHLWCCIWKCNDRAHSASLNNAASDGGGKWARALSGNDAHPPTNTASYW